MRGVQLRTRHDLVRCTYWTYEKRETQNTTLPKNMFSEAPTNLGLTVLFSVSRSHKIITMWYFVFSGWSHYQKDLERLGNISVISSCRVAFAVDMRTASLNILRVLAHTIGKNNSNCSYCNNSLNSLLPRPRYYHYSGNYFVLIAFTASNYCLKGLHLQSAAHSFWLR